MSTTFGYMASGLSTNAVNTITMGSDLPSTMNATVEMTTQQPSGWLGSFGWLIYMILNLVSIILYWVLRIATINVPSILYTLFSTSWTVTMNATTLYVPIPSCVRLYTDKNLGCSSWPESCRPSAGSSDTGS